MADMQKKQTNDVTFLGYALLAFSFCCCPDDKNNISQKI